MATIRERLLLESLRPLEGAVPCSPGSFEAAPIRISVQEERYDLLEKLPDGRGPHGQIIYRYLARRVNGV